MPFAEEFAIGSRRVGGDAPVYVIAEAGVAHFGRPELARQLFEIARDGGADAFKLQVFDVETLVAPELADWRERLRDRVLPLAVLKQLRGACAEAGLDFILTAHDTSRIAWLDELDVAAVKIGSGERNNPEFVRRLAALGRPVILSTGMYRRDDVREMIDACASAGCDRLALLHCVTAYPTPDAEVNLRAMAALRQLFPGPVGYSDHTPDVLAVLAAVAAGARIVEKHITVLRDVPNAQDWKVSADKEQFAALVRDIRRVERMLGSGRKEPSASENASERWAVKGLVAARELRTGHVLASGDVIAKRAGGGIPPNRIDDILGRRLVRDLRADERVTADDVE